MDRSRQKTLLTVLLIAYALVMMVGAIIPNPSDVPVFSGNTKYFHFVGFIVLAMLTLKTFEVYRFKHRYILSTVALIFFIILTESLQLLVSTRSFSVADMVVDAVGCIIGWGLYAWIYSRR